MPVSISKHVLPAQLLTQILEQPGIVDAVQALPPAVLSQWIHHIGLEDAGELVSLASPAQLTELFDDDLWRSERAGQDETFDADRFVLWLEVLLNTGVRLATRTVAGLDEDLLTLALCRNLFVIDIEELARRTSSGAFDDDEELDLALKELDGCLYQEIDQYRVIARNARTWEPLRTLLLELDTEQPTLFARLLERCCHISGEYIEDNGGLYEVLSSDEMVEADVAAEREERRTRQGYVAPSAATSFLRHAREEPLETLLASEAVDPMTHAYFRDAEAPALAQGARASELHTRASELPAKAAPGGSARPSAKQSAVVAGAATTSVAALLASLRAAEIVEPQSASPLLPARSEPGGARADDSRARSRARTKKARVSRAEEPPLVSAIRAVRSRDESAHGRRLHELAYLANVLIAGDSPRRRALGRALRPVEAAESVLEICQRGATRALAAAGQRVTHATLTELLACATLVKMFRIGWHVSSGAD
jgi:hypothetical protein